MAEDVSAPDWSPELPPREDVDSGADSNPEKRRVCPEEEVTWSAISTGLELSPPTWERTIDTKRSTEAQIIPVLRESDGGARTEEPCRKYAPQTDLPQLKCEVRRDDSFRCGLALPEAALPSFFVVNVIAGLGPIGARRAPVCIDLDGTLVLVHTI